MAGTFQKKTDLPFSAETVFNWHVKPGAIERLSPPWDPIVVLEKIGGIESGATVKMKMKAGPASYIWHARHTGYEAGRGFVDEQINGPFKSWKHTHRFEPIDEHHSFLEDQIDYVLPLSAAASPFFGPIVGSKLSRIFTFRHFTTRNDLERHQNFRSKKRLSILISGASGLVGRNLVPFLTTGGHRVFKLVRRPVRAPDEIFWEPQSGVLDLSEIDSLDAVIHLAGENIGVGRWTAKQKRIIIDSRTKTTSLLVSRVADIKSPPTVFLSSSAVGYYGDRGDDELDESDPVGKMFISDVCEKWETAALPATENGMRLVLMRIGVVLDPRGGALSRLLMPFQMGIGGRIGDGQQYISWITLDDAIGAMYHCLLNDGVRGPVNIVAPNPITNAEFTRILGKTLRRPTLTILPPKAITTIFGQQGLEVLLSSARVYPEKLSESGFTFYSQILTSALSTILGKNR